MTIICKYIIEIYIISSSTSNNLIPCAEYGTFSFLENKSIHYYNLKKFTNQFTKMFKIYFLGGHQKNWTSPSQNKILE